MFESNFFKNAFTVQQKHKIKKIENCSAETKCLSQISLEMLLQCSINRKLKKNENCSAETKCLSQISSEINSTYCSTETGRKKIE